MCSEKESSNLFNKVGSRTARDLNVLFVPYEIICLLITRAVFVPPIMLTALAKQAIFN